MNAIRLLKKDHQQILLLLKQIGTTTARGLKKREKLFEEFAALIDTHSKIEEKVFYPAMLAYTKTKDLVLEAYEEHHYADVIIADLNKLDFENEKWMAKFNVLNENLKHHIKEEENKLFTAIQKLMNAAELNWLGDEMEELKENLNANIISSVVSSLISAPNYFFHAEEEIDILPNQKNSAKKIVSREQMVAAPRKKNQHK